MAPAWIPSADLWFNLPLPITNQSINRIESIEWNVGSQGRRQRRQPSSRAARSNEMHQHREEGEGQTEIETQRWEDNRWVKTSPWQPQMANERRPRAKRSNERTRVTWPLHSNSITGAHSLNFTDEILSRFFPDSWGPPGERWGGGGRSRVISFA